MAKPVSRCWGTFWSLIEHLPHAKRYSGVVSQHCVPLQLDQKVCIQGLLQYKWLEHWPALMAKPVSRCWGIFWSLIEHLPHAKRYSGVVSRHCVPLQLDQKVCIHGLTHYKWLEHWLALMAKPVFQVLRSFCDLDRLAFVGKKVSRWSHSALQQLVPLYWAKKNLYSRFHGLIKYNRLVCGLAFMYELTRFWRTLSYTW